MEKHLRLLIIVCLIVALFGSSEGSGTKVTKLKVNLREQEQLQRAVDKGHQPWRLDPVGVAHAAVMGADGHWQGSGCRIVSETDKKVRVGCQGTKDYVVSLRRLVKPKGIWTPVSIEAR